MNQLKIDKAVERFEQNLPLRRNQTGLPETLRRLHRFILRHYLETGKAPTATDFGADISINKESPGYYLS